MKTKTEILIATPEDLKKFILNNELTDRQISNLIFSTLKVFIINPDKLENDYKKNDFIKENDKIEIIKKIDEVLKKYPIGKRPIFFDYSLND